MLMFLFKWLTTDYESPFAAFCSEVEPHLYTKRPSASPRPLHSHERLGAWLAQRRRLERRDAKGTGDAAAGDDETGGDFRRGFSVRAV